MPYVHLNVSRPLTAEQIEKARDTIASMMDTLPGKNRDNTMIHIDGGCALTKGDDGKPCIFLEVRLYKASPDENKKAFVQKAADALCAMFEVEPEKMYVNMIELPEWGVGGRFF